MTTRIVVAVLVFTFAIPTASAEAPDWRGELRVGQTVRPIEAWFDGGRTRGFLRVSGWTSPIFRAWKVAVADLDGDGTDEVVLGIWSDQPRHAEPDPHRTVWVLRWDDRAERLVEAWRGSALARPLRDFTVAEHPRGDRLVAAERGRDGCFATTYRWTGFGFAAERRAPSPCPSAP